MVTKWIKMGCLVFNSLSLIKLFSNRALQYSKLSQAQHAYIQFIFLSSLHWEVQSRMRVLHFEKDI